MNRFKLGVCNCRLSYRRQRVIVAKLAQVAQQCAELFGRRWYEDRRQRVVLAAADPVLDLAQTAGMLSEPRVRKQPVMIAQNSVNGDFATRPFERVSHRIHIRENFESGDVANVAACCAVGGYSQKALRGILRPSMCAEATDSARKSLRVGKRHRAGIETRNGNLGVSDVRCYLTLEGEGPSDKRLGNEGVINAASAIAAGYSDSGNLGRPTRFSRWPIPVLYLTR